jgi:membrane protease YdiL (CAAX protease family)
LPPAAAAPRRRDAAPRRRRARAAGAHAGPALALYVVGCFAAAALAAPAVYQPAGAADASRRSPRSRATRCTASCTACCCLRRRRAAGAPARARHAQLARPRARPPWAHRRDFALGALLGGTAIAATAALPLLVDARDLKADLTAGGFVVARLGALAAALAVAPLEELLFRGVVDGGLRRWRAPGARAGAVALVASSAFYAIVHFFTRPPNPKVVTWASGFDLLAGMFAGFGEPRTLLPQLFTLFVVGLCLAALYRRTGALWASVGVHAGGIFMLKVYTFAVINTPRDVDQWFWGTGRLVDGWVALGAVLLTTLAGVAAFRRLDRRAARPSPATPPAADAPPRRPRPRV